MTRDEIRTALAAPFPPDVVGWKPQMVKNNRALVAAYIDARDVQDRLDEVLGVDGWECEYTPLADGNVMCRLTLWVNGKAVVKSDVGGESEQPDSGDRTKAAFSDALKRAAVHAGVGRYLYRLPTQWCDYDPAKKQLAQTPRLPAWAIPVAVKPATAPAPVSRPPASSDHPAVTDGKAFADLLAQAGFAGKDRYGRALDILNREYEASYTPETRWSEVPIDHRRALVAHLVGLMAERKGGAA